MSIRRPLRQDSNLNANSIPTKSLQTITPKPLTADLPFGVAALVIEEVNLIKIRAAGHLALGPLLTTMDLHIGVERVISITPSGPRPDLMVVVEAKVHAPTLTAPRILLHVRHQQVVRPRLWHPRMEIIPDLRTGSSREQMSGLNHHQRMTLRHLCRLQPVMYRLPQTKGQNSVLL